MNILNKGDSGSPLWCMNGENPIVYGLVSGGKELCNSGAPAVFANVSKYVQWIKDANARLNSAAVN